LAGCINTILEKQESEIIKMENDNKVDLNGLTFELNENVNVEKN